MEWEGIKNKCSKCKEDDLEIWLTSWYLQGTGLGKDSGGGGGAGVGWRKVGRKHWNFPPTNNQPHSQGESKGRNNSRMNHGMRSVSLKIMYTSEKYIVSVI
jgi:hypothetical protein